MQACYNEYRTIVNTAMQSGTVSIFARSMFERFAKTILRRASGGKPGVVGGAPPRFETLLLSPILVSR